MINKNDFKLISHDTTDNHDDYWFEVTGDTRNLLDNKYAEQGFEGVSSVAYLKDEDIVGINRIFHWSYDVVLSDDEELKSVLKELTKGE